MKNFKQFVCEGPEEPRAGLEKAWKNMHVTVRQEYPADVDDQFTGNVKKTDPRLADKDTGPAKEYAEETGASDDSDSTFRS